MRKNLLRVYCDGGARGNPGPAASAFVVFDTDGKVLAKEGRFIGQTTNNVAEYKAVLFALEWLVQNTKNQNAVFFLDSQLVVNQLTGKFKVKNKKLMELVKAIKNRERIFSGKIFYKNVSRKQNKLTDSLVNKTLNAKILNRQKHKTNTWDL